MASYSASATVHDLRPNYPDSTFKMEAHIIVVSDAGVVNEPIRNKVNNGLILTVPIYINKFSKKEIHQAIKRVVEENFDVLVSSYNVAINLD